MPKKILLADDSITIQKVVELTFSDGDYEVTAVNNGAKAVLKLAEMRPDIILSDIIMPEKNGYEVCEYVKSHPDYRNIPVVLLTGTFEPFDPDRAEKAGCDAVVTKPFESQSLIHKVEELIAQARSNEAAAPAAVEPEPEPPSAWSAPVEEEPEPWAPPVEEPVAAAPSPWMDEPEPEPEPEPAAPVMSAPEPFAHGADIFDETATPASPTTEMPFDAPVTPFDSEAAFGGETRAFPKMNFDDFAAPAPEPEPEPEPLMSNPEPSPWDEAPAFGGETRAFPKMSFEDMQAMASPAPEPEPEPEAPMAAAPEPSPWDEQPAFGGETRAFPKMSFDDFQSLQTPLQPEAAPEPEPEPLMTTPEASPWDETPEAPAFTEEAPAFSDDAAFGGETRAFPKMSFEDMQAMASPAPEPEPEPAHEDPSASASFSTSIIPPFTMPEPEPEQEPEPEPLSVAPEQRIEEIAPPPVEPLWSPVEAPQAAATVEELPAPAALAPETPSIPIRSADADLTDEQIDRIARRVVELMSEQVVRNIAWEVIPDMAEMVVKERIRQLEAE